MLPALLHSVPPTAPCRGRISFLLPWNLGQPRPVPKPDKRDVAEVLLFTFEAWTRRDLLLSPSPSRMFSFGDPAPT